MTPGLKIAPYKPFDGHFGVFSDSLPDGWGQLILRHLAMQGINSLSLNPLPERADVLLLAEKVGLDGKQAAVIYDEMIKLTPYRDNS